MPTIRIDEDVYKGLQSFASPFEDSPNSVIRRLLNLDNKAKKMKNISDKSAIFGSGKKLNKAWGVHAKQAYFHKDGWWYMNLKDFPGGYFEPNGYVLFKTKKEYENCSHLKIGKTTNLQIHLSQFPNYVKVK